MTAEIQLEGAIDHFAPDMRIQGWARNIADQFAIIRVGIAADDRLVAIGKANRFRPDLFEKNVGHGWYGFALRPSRPLDWEGIGEFRLIDLDARMLIGSYRLPLPAKFNPPRVDLRQLNLIPNEFLVDVGHLRGFAPLLEHYVAHYGSETFVDHAYCFVLGRPADDDGLRTYSRQIAGGQLRPVELLKILLDSEEARRSCRRLPSPQADEFPIRWL
jgi:hypothetical protein